MAIFNSYVKLPEGIWEYNELYKYLYIYIYINMGLYGIPPVLYPPGISHRLWQGLDDEFLLKIGDFQSLSG